MENAVIKSIAGPAAVLIIILILAIPFINQPVHIDDWVFMTGAEHFGRQPLNPLDGTIGFFGREVPFSLVTHPPLLFLYISLIKLITGRLSLLLLHICYLPFSLLAGISVFLLAKRFSRLSLFITLLFLFTPVYMVMSHGLMSDLPMISLFLSALAAYIYGLERNQSELLILSSALAALTVLCSYQGLFLFFLLFLYTLLNRAPKKTFLLVSILPLCLLIAWLLYVRQVTGKFHISAALYWTGHNYLLSFTRIIDGFTGSICSLGGITIFPLSLFFLPWKSRKKVSLYLISIIITLYFLFSRAAGYIPGTMIAFFIFFLAGLLITSRIFINTLAILKNNGTLLHRLRKRKDEAFLGIWYLSFLALVVLFLPHGIPRYLLPITFPLIAIAMIGFEKYRGRKVAGVFLGLTLIFTLGMGILVSRADYQNARINERAAEDIAERFAGKEANITFTGEFGFRHYMEKKGCKYLLSDSDYLNTGAILVEPESYFKGGISPKLKQNLELIDRLKYPVSPPLTIMSQDDRADFYGQYYGFLPYFPVGRKQRERGFNLYKYITPTHYSNPGESIPAGIADKRPLYTFSHNLSLMDWRINRLKLDQGDRLEIILRWKVEEDFNPDFSSYLRLSNRYSPLVLIHDRREDETDPHDWKKGEIIEETYTIAHISKNTYPGKYEVSTGIIPGSKGQIRQSDLSGNEYESYRIGTIEIDPRIYRAGLTPETEERYFPRFQQFSGPPVSFTLTRDKEINIPVTSPAPVSSIRIISFLAYASTLEEGEEIAVVTVIDKTGKVHDLYLKAQEHTADWAIEHPGYDRSIYKHDRAGVYTKWRADYKGSSFWGYKYITYLRLNKSVIPVIVKMKYINNTGVLIVDDFALVETFI